MLDWIAGESKVVGAVGVPLASLCEEQRRSCVPRGEAIEGGECVSVLAGHGGTTSKLHMVLGGYVCRRVVVECGESWVRRCARDLSIGGSKLVVSNMSNFSCATNLPPWR